MATATLISLVFQLLLWYFVNNKHFKKQKSLTLSKISVLEVCLAKHVNYQLMVSSTDIRLSSFLCPSNKYVPRISNLLNMYGMKDSLQSEAEGVNDENFRFYGRCTHHDKDVDCGPSTITVSDIICSGDILRCARTEGYKKRKWDNVLANLNGPYQGKCGSFVPQDQINAWTHIHGQKKCSQAILQLPRSVAESDCRKEYGCYKQAKGWKRLVVYKSGIHALGLYASQFICRGEMVVEYVGEIVGLRIADKREREYQSGRRIQCKSACYFFRIDKEHIIDATRKGGIARFVNHSCLPNCFAKVISVRDEKKVVFFAQRDILPGEEITYDYHFNYEDEGKKIPCYCKSKNCRLYLN